MSRINQTTQLIFFAFVSCTDTTKNFAGETARDVALRYAHVGCVSMLGQEDDWENEQRGHVEASERTAPALSGLRTSGVEGGGEEEEVEVMETLAAKQARLYQEVTQAQEVGVGLCAPLQMDTFFSL